MTGPPKKIIVSTLNQGCRGAGVVFSGVVGTQHFCIGIQKKCWYPSVCIGINGMNHTHDVHKLWDGLIHGYIQGQENGGSRALSYRTS